MDNSFTLLSTMSPKVKITSRKVIRQKVPTKLALKKNMRRSSIFDNLPPTAANNSLIFVESSTTDTTNSNSSRMGVIKNSSPITICDSDSTESEYFTSSEKSASIHNEIPNNCGLSEAKVKEIKKWVSNVEHVDGRSSGTFSNELELDVAKSNTVTKKDCDFDELINSIKRTLRLDELSTNKASNDKFDKNDFITNKNVQVNKNSSTVLTPTINIANNNVSSSSDVIENSDCEKQYHNKFEASFLGANCKHTENVFPQSEPRYRKKRRENSAILKTEVNLKPKWANVHKNPYLDYKYKLGNTSSIQRATLESPWSKRLQALCDSDSSDQSFNEAPPKHHLHPGIQLDFGDKECGKGDLYHNDIMTLFKNVITLEKPNMNSSEKTIAKNGDNTPVDRIRRKLSHNNHAKFPVSRHNHREESVVLDKPNTCVREEKKYIKNKQNIGNVNSEKENFSDFSEDNETLEDKLKKKFTVDTIQKILVSRETKNKITEHDLKNVLNKKRDNIENKNISISNVHNDAVLGNDELLKKTKIYKKKTTTKAKAVKKKPLTSSSEDSDSGGIVINKKSNHTSVAAKDSIKHSNNICKSFLSSLSGSVPISQCDPSARIFRNNFKIYRHELLNKLFKLYNEKIFENAIPDDSLLEWSERMRGTAGYCYCKKIVRRTGLVERKVRIVLASKVLDRADRLRDTLIHEMCHAATWIVNEVSDGHGNYWKAWAHKARQIFPELPPIKVCHNYAIATKYTYKCTDCGYSFGRHSKSINVEKKRCGHCYGVFEILINKTTKGGETKTVPVTPKKKATGFALFVKENYATYKIPQLNHAQVMKMLGQKYGELKISVCKQDEEKA